MDGRSSIKHLPRKGNTIQEYVNTNPPSRGIPESGLEDSATGDSTSLAL
jgi:hypothetical protein